MFIILKRLTLDMSAGSAVEYALLLGALVLAAFVAISDVGVSLRAAFRVAAEALQRATGFGH